MACRGIGIGSQSMDWDVKGAVLADTLNLVGIPCMPHDTSLSGSSSGSGSGSGSASGGGKFSASVLSEAERGVLRLFEDEQTRRSARMQRLYPPPECEEGAPDKCVQQQILQFRFRPVRRAIFFSHGGHDDVAMSQVRPFV